MSGDQQAPWAAAWREWMSLASKGFKPSATTNSFDPRAASASNFAEPYLAFVRAIQQMLTQGGGQDFARRFVEALRSAARQPAGAEANDEFLNIFLRAAPAALLGAFPDANAGQAWRQFSTTLAAWAGELLALPAVGPQREWADMLKTVQRAVLSETQARAVLDEHYRLATRAALHGFANFLSADDGTPIATVRALYDAWIEQAEAAYAERVMSEAFARDFAGWVNAGSDVRLALRSLGGRLSALFDAPAREEIDALLERQQAMQRELSALRAERQETRDELRIAESPVNADAVVERSTPPVIKTTTRAARATTRTVVRPASTIEKSTAKPRAKVPKPRQPKAARGEFDIARILDGGK
jgi:class III poly(R)-hydroxyalkanoic acid synthase PhaE subunit